MRVLFVSLTALLVAFSTTNSQIVERPITLVDVVGRAFVEIVALSDIVVAEAQAHFDSSRAAFLNLASQVVVTGAVPALAQTAKYLQSDDLLYAQNIHDKVGVIYGTIIAGIHYQVNQLSQGSTEDANQLIADCIETIFDQINIIRAASTQRLINILAASSANVLRLHQLALQDCGAHLADLNNQLSQTVTDALENLTNEWAHRFNNIRHVVLVNSNQLLVRVANLDSRVITLPAIRPPSC